MFIISGALTVPPCQPYDEDEDGVGKGKEGAEELALGPDHFDCEADEQREEEEQDSVDTRSTMARQRVSRHLTFKHYLQLLADELCFKHPDSEATCRYSVVTTHI